MSLPAVNRLLVGVVWQTRLPRVEGTGTKGSFCPTSSALPMPCFPGTYGNATCLQKVDDCNPCDGGYYSDEYELIKPAGRCGKGGHYCTLP